MRQWLQSNQAAPHLRQAYAFDADCRTPSRNGLFLCHPDTRVWGRVNNAVVEADLRAEFADIPGLTQQERRWMWTRRGAVALREEFAAHVLRPGFQADLLDGGLDIFPLGGGTCYDTAAGAFRPIRPADHVQLTAGWAYDAEAARRHRPDVDAFFQQLLPVPEERDVALRFLAGVLSGRRYVKKVMCLTDKRQGNNGKSTIVKLLTAFCGDLAVANNQLLLQSTMQRGRDDHGAGLQPFKGFRLALSEELKKTQKMDEGVVKNLSGGEQVTVSGRCIGTGDRYKFIWSALLVCVFNDGDLPQFDATDAAFVGRLLITPMRSKFVPGYEPRGVDGEEGEEPYTYAADPQLATKMLQWRSALLDVFRERYVPDDIADDDIPEGMREWRRGVVNDRNDLAEWLEQHVVKGGTRDGFAVKDVYPYVQDMVGKKAFFDGAVAWFRTNGFEYRDKGSMWMNGEWKTCRHIVRHAKFVL